MCSISMLRPPESNIRVVIYEKDEEFGEVCYDD